MIKDDRQWLSVADAFQAASVGAGTWLDALEQLAHATGSRAGQLIGFGSDKAIPFNQVTDLSQDWAEDFMAHGGGDPATNPHVREGARLGELDVLVSNDMVTPEERRSNPLFAVHTRQYDVPYICLTSLVRQPDMLVGLAVLRSESQGNITDRERAVFSSLAPHVRAAVKTQMSLEHQGAEPVAGTLEALSFAAFVCDRQGKVRAMTPSAEELVSEGDALKLRKGVLGATSRAESRHLVDVVGNAAVGLIIPGDPVTRSMVVAVGSDTPLALDIITLPRRDFMFSFNPRVLVIARTPQTDPNRTAKLLQIAHGLTAAEVDVALRLAEGQTPAAIAEARRSALNTVRTQIRAVHQKLGVRRASELVTRVRAMG